MIHMTFRPLYPVSKDEATNSLIFVVLFVVVVNALNVSVRKTRISFKLLLHCCFTSTVNI